MIFVCTNRIAEWNDVYGDGVFATNVAFPYVVVINNISQFTAMYCLVLFYKANKVRGISIFKRCDILQEYTSWLTSYEFLSRLNWNLWNHYQNFCVSKLSFSLHSCKLLIISLKWLIFKWYYFERSLCFCCFFVFSAVKALSSTF